MVLSAAEKERVGLMQLPVQVDAFRPLLGLTSSYFLIGQSLWVDAKLAILERRMVLVGLS